MVGEINEHRIALFVQKHLDCTTAYRIDRKPKRSSFVLHKISSTSP